MKAVRFTTPAGDERIGALQDGTIVDAGPADPLGFAADQSSWERIAAADGERYAVADVTLLHPVQPRKILAIGLNYRSHAEESELDVPSVPVVFASCDTTTLPSLHARSCSMATGNPVARARSMRLAHFPS